MTTNAAAPAGPTHDTVTPDQIFQLAQGFMASKHLFAASELGLFEALGEGPVDLAGLAARTGLTPRTARISADAMVALQKRTTDLAQSAGNPPATTNPTLTAQAFDVASNVGSSVPVTVTVSNGRPRR